MKLNEFYQEEPGSSFTHDGTEYLLNPLIKFSDKIPVKQLPVDDLSWITIGQDPERFDYTDLEIPILITQWNGKLVVIDGYHRLLKAMDKGLTTIPTKLIPKDLLIKFKK